LRFDERRCEYRCLPPGCLHERRWGGQDVDRARCLDVFERSRFGLKWLWRFIGSGVRVLDLGRLVVRHEQRQLQRQLVIDEQ
jgi:hypothetical protein